VLGLTVLDRVMSEKDPQSESRPQIVQFARGGQAVINGALVTAPEACTLEVGVEAFVMTGRTLWPQDGPLINPRDELYFSLMEAGTDPERFERERFRLFQLLSQVVAQSRTRDGQKECARCAAALLACDAEAATRSASRLAAAQLADAHHHTRPSHRPPQLRRFGASE